MSLATWKIMAGKNLLHYYSGKIRAFWEDKIFFADQRNVAVVSIKNLYIHGEKATQDDTTDLEWKLENSSWNEAPELFAYVKIYIDPPSWPYNFSGKLPWLACYAWVGCIPKSVEEEVHQQNILYMPLSYYTGKPLKCFKDKILFGDLRNSVMVLRDNLYINGGKCQNEGSPVLDDNDPLIHAYITKLSVLTDRKYTGPEPHLPTWPKDTYGPDTWVARFAWQGEMPDVVRQQVYRFYVIRMYEWDDLDSIMGIKSKESESGACSYNFSGLRSEGTNGIVRETKRLFTGHTSESDDTTVPLIPIQQHLGHMKGSLMMADHDQGLMTSYVDVIAFTKDDFYINGEKFKSNASLCDFFQDRKVPLMAWVVPLEKPKLVFNVHVAWRAVCVWFGSTPKNLEYLKKIKEEQFQDNNITESDAGFCRKLTHFMGVVTNLSFASGVLISKVTPKLSIKISFKRKAVYMYGYRFHSSCSLLDKQQTIESYTWSVLAYPVQETKSGFPQYSAVAVWQYQYQHFLTNELFLKALSDVDNMNSETQSNESKNSPITEEWGRHMSGWVVKIKPDHGVIQSGSTQVEATCVYFKRSVLYVDGEILSSNVNLHTMDTYRQCNVYAKPIPPTIIDGITVTMEATLVWIGKKPQDIFTAPYGKKEENGIPLPSCIEEGRKVDNEKENNITLSSCSEEGMKVHTNIPSGQMVIGCVLMADESVGLMTVNDKIVYFTMENFYMHGEKFKLKGRSLYEYLHSRKVDIRAWIIPLQKNKLVLNCSVSHQAVCAWIGREPDALAVMQLEQKMPQDDGPLLHSWSSEVMFSYCIGRVSNLSTSSGVITCIGKKIPVKAAFWNKMLFINGERLSQDSDLQQYASLLWSSSWCLLAYKVLPRDFMGEKVIACAVAVWQVDNQHQICSELQQITSVKAKQLAPGRLPTKTAVDGATKADKAISGLIMSAEDNYGIIKNGSQPLVFFQRSSLIIDGRELENEVSIKEFINVPCCFLAHRIPLTNIGKHQVAMEASVVWLQKKPQDINGYSQISESSASKNGDEKCNELAERITKISIETANDLLENPKENDSPYVGRHITGKIIYIGSDGGVASWYSVEGEGTIYVEFLSDDVYIDLVPLRIGNFTLEDVQNRCGNFYVVPVKHHTVCGYRVSLLATCGWYGQKPPFIPMPGEQECANITLEELYITLDAPNALCQSHGQDLQSYCHNSQLSNMSMANNIPQPNHYEENLMNPKLGPEEGGENGSSIFSDVSHLRGIIVELHSNVGRLEGADGEHHYFSRDNCFLFGVTMKSVELWHVLIQGQEVTYELGEIVAGASKVQAVWVGPQKCNNKQETAVCISEWCKKNLVPDGARDLLIAQLEVL